MQNAWCKFTSHTPSLTLSFLLNKVRAVCSEGYRNSTSYCIWRPQRSSWPSAQETVTCPIVSPLMWSGYQFPLTKPPFTGCPPYVICVWWTEARFLPWRRPEPTWPPSHLCFSGQGGSGTSRDVFTTSAKSAETSKGLCWMTRLSESEFANSEKRTTKFYEMGLLLRSTTTTAATTTWPRPHYVLLNVLFLQSQFSSINQYRISSLSEAALQDPAYVALFSLCSLKEKEERVEDCPTLQRALATRIVLVEDMGSRKAWLIMLLITWSHFHLTI